MSISSYQSEHILISKNEHLLKYNNYFVNVSIKSKLKDNNRNWSLNIGTYIKWLNIQALHFQNNVF